MPLPRSKASLLDQLPPGLSETQAEELTQAIIISTEAKDAAENAGVIRRYVQNADKVTFTEIKTQDIYYYFDRSGLSFPDGAMLLSNLGKVTVNAATFRVSNGFRINWTPLVGSTIRYRIYMGAGFDNATGQLTGMVSGYNPYESEAGASFRVVAGLSPSTEYFYYIVAVTGVAGTDTFNEGDPSPVVSTETTAANTFLTEFVSLATNGWDLDDDTGTTAVAQKGISGTFNGGFTLNQTRIDNNLTGKSSVLFNGTSGYMQASLPSYQIRSSAPTEPGVIQVTKLAMMCFVKTPAPNASGSRVLMSLGNSGGNIFIVQSQDADPTKLNTRVRRDDAVDARGQINVDRTAFDGNGHVVLCYLDLATGQMKIAVDSSLEVNLAFTIGAATFSFDRVTFFAHGRGTVTNFLNGFGQYALFAVNNDVASFEAYRSFMAKRLIS